MRHAQSILSVAFAITLSLAFFACSDSSSGDDNEVSSSSSELNEESSSSSEDLSSSSEAESSSSSEAESSSSEDLSSSSEAESSSSSEAESSSSEDLSSSSEAESSSSSEAESSSSEDLSSSSEAESSSSEAESSSSEDLSSSSEAESSSSEAESSSSEDLSSSSEAESSSSEAESSSSEVSSSSSLGEYWNPNIKYGTLTDDRDGKTYRTVVIGTQVWMAENLNYTPESGNSWCYNDEVSKCDVYGRLYDWATAMAISLEYNSSTWGGSDVNHQGVCPSGWHLPSDAEWTILTDFAGGSTAGTKLKASSGWNSSSGIPLGTDDYGFSALPGGYGYKGDFNFVGNYGNWWNATEASEDYVNGKSINYNREYVVNNTINKYQFLYGLRCVKD